MLNVVFILVGAVLFYTGATGSYQSLLATLKGQASKPSAGPGA